MIPFPYPSFFVLNFKISIRHPLFKQDVTTVEKVEETPKEIPEEIPEEAEAVVVNAHTLEPHPIRNPEPLTLLH